MNTDNDRKVPGRQQLNQVTERIIGCAFTVANALGHGFLEKVSENALAHELRKAGVAVAQQRGGAVHFDGVVVGEYTADLVVEDSVILELKAVKALEDAHLAQCMNYLKATGLELALLVNFGAPRVEVRRVVLGYETSTDGRTQTEPSTDGRR